MSEEHDRTQRERDWGERLLLWIVVAVIMVTLGLALLFQVLA